MENLADVMKRTAFFSDLSREDLARIAGRLEERKVSSGQAIVRQGEAGDALYVVQSGAVEVVLESNGVSAESLAVLGPHECFGEMALFTGEKRSATVRAFVDSVVLKLSKENWEELIAKHPFLSLHFCKVLSRRLAETDRDISQGRGSFNLVMEEFFEAQAPPLQDFLLRTSVLKALELEAIRSVLSIDNPREVLGILSSNYPTFLRADGEGRYEYRDYLRDFLTAKFKQTVGRDERSQLHQRFASYFSGQGRWVPAIEHYVQAEAWREALELIETHGEGLLERESPTKILALLGNVPDQVAHRHGYIPELRAEAYVRLGDLDGAIRSYQKFLGQRPLSTKEVVEIGRYYQRLAELHQKKGETGEAMGYLRLTATMLEEGKWNLEAVQAMQSVEALQQRSGLQQGALNWGSKALSVAAKLRPRIGNRFLSENKKWMGPLLALAVGWAVWQMPPAAPLDERGVRFLATLTAAVILWVFEVFDDYIVALMLLPIWFILGIAPADMAFAGFSKSSWFFVLAALGMGAAVTRSGLLYRVALQALRRFPPHYRIYTSILSVSGLFFTPLLPSPRARMAIIAPISLSISDAIGFKPRSNGSAGLVLSAYMGFTQMAFMFLTGANFTLVGWNLLPEDAKSVFGWGTWVLAALPAGIFSLLALFIAIQVLFRPEQENQPKTLSKTLETQLEILGPLTRAEWLSLAVLAFAVAGWITKPMHGIGETWVAVAAFIIFLLSGVLDKKGLKNNIDWGLLLLVGVLLTLAVLVPALKLDRWLIMTLSPVLSLFSFHPLPFLFLVALVIYVLCFFLRRTAVVILVMLTLMPWARDIGIHPGVFLLSVAMSVDSWFLPYQSDSYQIAYYGTDEKAFSHAQARKLMVVKFFASLIAIAISIPYWKVLGFID